MIEYNKKAWPPGPWQTEPDRVESREFGYPTLIVRSRIGALCGYVGVPPGHPWFGMEWPEDRSPEIAVHGGITFSGPCQKDGPICHHPMPGEPDNVWWLGFDCAHASDYVPGIISPVALELMSRWKLRYRDIGYVTSEIRLLAAQCAEAADRYAERYMLETISLLGRFDDVNE
jgi:hypothetical protein